MEQVSSAMLINSSSELHQPPATDSSGFLLDASSLDSSYEKSFQCGSPVVKQLSFDSLVSSPSCPDELKPRCIIFDNSFHVSSTEEDISAEIPNTCNDSGSHVAKELSFDSPVSLPSCPNELKPRCIIFDISFDVSSTEDISTEISNSCHDSGSHVAKQLSFDSPVSSPSCSTKTYQLRPRCISFDDGFRHKARPQRPFLSKFQTPAKTTLVVPPQVSTTNFSQNSTKNYHITMTTLQLPQPRVTPSKLPFTKRTLLTI